MDCPVIHIESSPSFINLNLNIFMFFFLFHLVISSTPHRRSLGKCCLDLTSSINWVFTFISQLYSITWVALIPYNPVSGLWSLQWFPHTFLGVGNARGLDVSPVAPYIAEPDTIPNSGHSPWPNTVHCSHIWRSIKIDKFVESICGPFTTNRLVYCPNLDLSVWEPRGCSTSPGIHRTYLWVCFSF